jgi:hypothetical protein
VGKIVEIVTNPELIQVSFTNFESSAVEEELLKLSKRLDGKELERERLLSAYRRGIIDIDDLEQQMDQIKSEIQSIEERKEELEEMLVASSAEERVVETLYEQLETIQERIENCSFEDKHEIIKLIVRRVWLDREGNVEIEVRIPLSAYPKSPPIECIAYRNQDFSDRFLVHQSFLSWNVLTVTRNGLHSKGESDGKQIC